MVLEVAVLDVIAGQETAFGEALVIIAGMPAIAEPSGGCGRVAHADVEILKTR